MDSPHFERIPHVHILDCSEIKANILWLVRSPEPQDIVHVSDKADRWQLSLWGHHAEPADSHLSAMQSSIEPTSESWEASVLPPNYARSLFLIERYARGYR